MIKIKYIVYKYLYGLIKKNSYQGDCISVFYFVVGGLRIVFIVVIIIIIARLCVFIIIFIIIVIITLLAPCEGPG